MALSGGLPSGFLVTRMCRICIVSDDLAGPPDEGVRKFTVAISAALGRTHDVAVLTTSQASPVAGVRSIPASKTFLSRPLRAAIRQIEPDVLIYATHRSATYFSFIRARILAAYAPSAQIVLLGLQTRRHRWWQRQLIRLIRPDLVIVQSSANQEYLEGIGCRAAVIHSGVDAETFQPVDDERRHALRVQYGITGESPVVLHVGHLQAGRGIAILGERVRSGGCQVLLVASSSTTQEEAVRRQLEQAGVRIVSEYLPRIEELYQLADCYVFPVATTDNAIEVPLSVLEALACDLPVVTTRFGGLPAMFPGPSHPGLVFVATPAELVSETLRLCRQRVSGLRPLSLPYSWEAAANGLLARAIEAQRRVA
ncbi:MAG TPA: glycosyltransferase family 4 protein [Thermomicrobiales bacterium]|nr:glycosyltransferase family 4 protein [Thermomicrobiales bacterium]